MIFVFTCQVISDIIPSRVTLQMIVDCLQIYLNDEQSDVLYKNQSELYWCFYNFVNFSNKTEIKMCADIKCPTKYILK